MSLLNLGRQYLGRQQQLSGTSNRVNIPAPTGGLNTRDSESLMDQLDAVEMDNWFPDQGKVTTRNGSTSYVTGLTGQVETLMEYYAGSTRVHMCANNGEINNITNPASVANLGSGFSNNRWQYANFNANMLLVNGQDTPQVFNGSSLSNSTISGPTVTNLDGVNVHKGRVYVWDSSSQDFWYGATNAIGGTFTQFPLSRVARGGGNLIAMETWNLDGGDGVDDYALFLMSSGEALLYSGSDPGDATNWSLVGKYKIGSPLAIRAVKKVAGDVVIITDRDFVFFSEVFKNDGAVTSKSKLSGAALDAAENYRSNYGWEIELYPAGNWLLFNVPIATNVTYVQYIINTITGAATKFTGMNGSTWGVYNDDLYFGGNGEVYKANDGLNDDGNFIECNIRQAYNNLGNPLPKTINSYRNTIKADGNVVVNSVVGFDYGISAVTQTTSTASSGTPWGSAWGSPWSPQSKARSALVLSSGSGVDVSMRLYVSLKGQQVQWYRTDYNYTINNIV